MTLEITKAKYCAPFQMEVEFNDGETKLVDFSQILAKNYPAFAPLKDNEVFKKFRVTTTIEWENEDIDIAPEYLYSITQHNKATGTSSAIYQKK